MKLKNKYLVFLVLTGMVILNGCKTTENAAVKKAEDKGPNFQPWDDSLRTGRPFSEAQMLNIYYYNNADIFLTSVQRLKFSDVVDGKVPMTDSVITYTYKVPIYTKGLIVKHNSDWSQVCVRFDEISLNVYMLWFEKNHNREYTVMHKGGSITRKDPTLKTEMTFSVTAQTNYAVLLFEPLYNIGNRTISGEAGGVK